jgi:hypothetical protein
VIHGVLRLRGIVDTIDQAKHYLKKNYKLDNDFDIFTAEVGKFFSHWCDPFKLMKLSIKMNN